MINTDDDPSERFIPQTSKKNNTPACISFCWGNALGLGGDIEAGALTDHTRACGRAGARSDLRFLRALQMQIIK
jgi:hypothetical protein